MLQMQKARSHLMRMSLIHEEEERQEVQKEGACGYNSSDKSESKNEKANQCFMAMNESKEDVSNSKFFLFNELQKKIDSLIDEYKCIYAKNKLIRKLLTCIKNDHKIL